MPKAGPRKIEKYGDRFKATAVKLSSLPGVQIKDVAAALDIHPFMLSLWRKQVREGKIARRCLPKTRSTSSIKAGARLARWRMRGGVLDAIGDVASYRNVTSGYS